MPEVGDVLDGYQLDAVIGRGGMGTVYRATDRALEKTVALKVIAPHLADDQTFVQRFQEEAKALARLDADGIVDVYTMRETEAALFFVMEHIDGPSLQTVLQNRGALAPPQALSFLHQVLESVGTAHAAGVLHRDLKPSNILLDANGRAVITDFGLAKILTSDADLTATHEQLGTVSYMSPEQVEGLRNVEAASDLFSVGLIAYEVLTGRLPFDRSESDFLIQQAIVEASFPPPSAFAPEIPAAVEQVVLDLLAKDPADRPPSAQAARARLPSPDAGDDGAILDPDATPGPETALSVNQWIGIAVAVVLVLAGTYAGVRATLGLPILSVSAPTPAAESTPPAQAGTPMPQEPSPTDSGAAAAGPSQTSAADTSTSLSASLPDEEEQTSGAPPESSTAPPSAPAVLVIESQPSGATVEIDGAEAGQTPLTVDDVSPGLHRVTFRRANHRPVVGTVEVSTGDTARVVRSLSPRPAVVRLRVRPSGTVRIDGTRLAADTSGVVVDSLPPGAHRLALQSDLGRWETRVQLGAGEQYDRTVDFTQRVEVSITARTTDGRPLPNATVTVDGEAVGYTPQRLTRRVGQHTLRIEKDGYEPVERTVQFEPGMDTPIVIELPPQSE